ncbi:hypothetical protein GCM10022402_14430 [Salinactinospora qingdaonensis]|uniref:Uncharacterized protein n=1 Tax=Salinactinospora qingdaonensis TaxID=702744 RepID=A0ABP7FBG4_9ACTN
MPIGTQHPPARGFDRGRAQPGPQGRLPLSRDSGRYEAPEGTGATAAVLRSGGRNRHFGCRNMACGNRDRNAAP